MNYALSVSLVVQMEASFGLVQSIPEEGARRLHADDRRLTPPRIMAELAETRELVAGHHLDFPGIFYRPVLSESALGKHLTAKRPHCVIPHFQPKAFNQRGQLLIHHSGTLQSVRGDALRI